MLQSADFTVHVRFLRRFSLFSLRGALGFRHLPTHVFYKMEMSLRSALSFLLQNKLSVLFVASIIYVLSIAIYRRFLHPLAKVPGPLPASMTAYYHLYYNRRLIYELDRLHEEYGPIVRIGPNEVHLANVEHYDTIYHVGSKYNK